MYKHNFSAGPSILPKSVMQKAAEAAVDFNETGLSILEISHRSKGFIEVLDQAKSLVKELLDLDDDWNILFLSGGASSQFFMTAMNMLNPSNKAYYADTGTWSKKAIKEARLLGNIEVVASSADKNYTYIPKGYTVPSGGKYMHITTNNTIFGTQYHELPECDCPIVADMSSDIFSRERDISRFGLIYAGAQKNMGPAGVTLVLVRSSFLEAPKNDVPTMLKYQTHIEKDSSFNTPPVFPIYVSMLNLAWLKEQGGIKAISQVNDAKSKLCYSTIDSLPMFDGVVAREDRSKMNATFTLNKPELEGTFLEMCKAAGIEGIKGHRSVGGFRASMYNAMPLESVKALHDVMNAFAEKYG